MKISHQWLKNHIELSESPEKIAEILTKSGLEVEKIEPFEKIKGGLEGIVVGEVMTFEKHPDADKLSKTTVHIGNDTILPIVCGAPNVNQGQKVLVATVGTTLYPSNGASFKINKAKIRGAVSEGMICAEDEIGLGKSHEGIMVLPPETKVGTSAAQFFNFESDHIYEIGLTPNRADAASHLGVARDLKALLKRPCKAFDSEITIPNNNEKLYHIELQDQQACKRYSGIVIKGLSVNPSPSWLQNALKSIGVNPINNIVDITNYVLHDLGQPLHAYDLSKISGHKIIIKKATKEPYTGLDGIKRNLDADDLIIADNEKALCLAGVMGGKDSAIDEHSTAIFLESAYFEADVVRKSSQRHSIKTDSSFRFERGTDPEMVVKALQKATKLILEIAGGAISSMLLDEYPEKIQAICITTSYTKINQLIGKNIPSDFVNNTLELLDIKIKSTQDDKLELEVPAYRVDVKRPADIVEEVLRIYGYDNINLDHDIYAGYVSSSLNKGTEQIQKTISELLVGKGCYEIITNSLTQSKYASLLALSNTDVKIFNPLSETLDVMRQSLLFSGLEVVAHNINRKLKDLSLFEFGKTYHYIDGKYIEKKKLSIFLSGNQSDETWNTPKQAVDIFNLKELSQSILGRLGINKIKTSLSDYSPLEHGITISIGKENIGYIGKLNQSILKESGIKQAVFYGEFDCDLLEKYAFGKFTFQEIPKFPEVRRDLSLVLPKSIKFEEIEKIVKADHSGLIQKVNVFDIYEGEKIAPNSKSYSVSFVLIDKEKTLTDEKVDQVMHKLMSQFEKDLGANIRK